VARKPRKKSNSGVYHIILRGINRQSIFEDDEDRLKFIRILTRYKEISECRIFAYCLMDNHVHLMLQELKEPISLMLQRVCSSYVSWYNAKHERCGHLFQERFKSEPVENDSYFLTVLRYIHQNPVKAEIVRDIAEYQWSSYSEYTKHSIIVDKEYALRMFSDRPDESVERFAQFSRELNADSCLEIPETKTKLSDDDLRRIVRHRFNIDVSRICNELKENQSEILRGMKEVEGVTIRQIARLTGLSTTKVWRS